MSIDHLDFTALMGSPQNPTPGSPAATRTFASMFRYSANSMAVLASEARSKAGNANLAGEFTGAVDAALGDSAQMLYTAHESALQVSQAVDAWADDLQDIQNKSVRLLDQAELEKKHYELWCDIYDARKAAWSAAPLELKPPLHPGVVQAGAEKMKWLAAWEATKLAGASHAMYYLEVAQNGHATKIHSASEPEIFPTGWEGVYYSSLLRDSAGAAAVVGIPLAIAGLFFSGGAVGLVGLGVAAIELTDAVVGYKAGKVSGQDLAVTSAFAALGGLSDFAKLPIDAKKLQSNPTPKVDGDTGVGDAARRAKASGEQQRATGRTGANPDVEVNTSGLHTPQVGPNRVPDGANVAPNSTTTNPRADIPSHPSARPPGNVSPAATVAAPHSGTSGPLSPTPHGDTPRSQPETGGAFAHRNGNVDYEIQTPTPGTVKTAPAGGERFNDILNTHGADAARRTVDQTPPPHETQIPISGFSQRVGDTVAGLRESFKSLDPWVKAQPGHKMASDFLLPKPLRGLEVYDGIKAFQDGDALKGAGKISGYLAGWEPIVQSHLNGDPEAAAQALLTPGANGYLKNAQSVADMVQNTGQNVATAVKGQ